MRVIELLVDGQRVKLTTDENILRAVERGDLKPDSRVVITEYDEEVFFGAAHDDPVLKALFPEHMQPRAQKSADADTGTSTSNPVHAPQSRATDAEAIGPDSAVVYTPAVPVTQTQKHDDLARKYANVATPVETATTAEPQLKPRPWRHWVGKVFDVNVLILGALAVAYIIQGIMDPYGAGYMWLCVPAFFILDGLMMRIFGGSPGKLLVNIQVRKNGRNIGVISGVKRSLGSHIFGAGLWIPLLSMLTMLARYGSLTEKGRSEWDIKAGNTVIYGPIGGFRWLLIVLFFAIYVLLTLIGAAGA